MKQQRIQILCSGGCGASTAVQAEDASSVTYTCARCAPQGSRANTSRVHVSKETSRRIEETLASTPETAAEREVVEVQTKSGGTAFYEIDDVDASHDESIDLNGNENADDEKDDKNTERTTDDLPAKTVRVVAQPAPDRPRRPYHLLYSGPQPVIRTSNPDAPWGYDENDHPIGMPLIVKNCPSVPLIAAGVVIPEALPTEAELAVRAKMREYAEKVRREYAEELRRESEPEPEPDRYPHYNDIIGLTRQQLVDLLDRILMEESRTFRDKSQPKTKRLLPKLPVQAELRWLLNHRAEELKNEIKKSDTLIAKIDVKIVEQESVRHRLKKTVMNKERAPEDIPDNAYLVKLRRQTDEVIARLSARRGLEVTKRNKLKEEIKSIPDKAQALQARLDNWDVPENIVEEYPLTTIKTLILFRDVFVVPREDSFRGYVPRGYKYDAENACAAYRQIVFEFGEHKHAQEKFKYWRKFENAVIVQAMDRRLIPFPTEEQLSKFRSDDASYIEALMRADAEAKFRAEEDAAADDDPDFNPDDIAAIRKSGGATIGGRIRGGGSTEDGKWRSVSSFDGAIGFGERSRRKSRKS